MLAPAKVEEIERLLKEGKSERSVSRITGVSRVTVNRIHRRIQGLPDKVKAPQLRVVHLGDNDAKNSSPNRPKYLRCTGCGGLQQEDVPCFVCSTRKQNAKNYDCYMADLLTPSTCLSPLSAKHPRQQKVYQSSKGASNGQLQTH